MATGPLDTTKRKGSLDILTTDTGDIPEYLINGVPIGADDIVEITGTYTVLINDDIVIGDGTFTINLPPVASAIKILFIKSKAGGGTITVDPDGSETIEGSATHALTSGTAITIVPSSTGWQII